MQVNPLTREVLVKLVYYGPGLGGKTTSLQQIHQSAPPETRGQIVSLATPVDRTLYFDFLPLRLAPVRGHQVRLQLFTVPGQVYFNATRKLVLTGADGVVFVADSQRVRQDANLESMQNLLANLKEQGREYASLPSVYQYNKRDLPDVLSVEELDRTLNTRGSPAFPTCAVRGEGILDSLDTLVQLVLTSDEALKVFGEPSEAPIPVELSRADEALEQQIGKASERLWEETVERAMVALEQTVQPSEVGSTNGRLSDRVDRAISDPPRATRRASRIWGGVFDRHTDRAGRIETALEQKDYPEAVRRADALLTELLNRAAQTAGLEPPPTRETVVLLLGLDGRRWLEVCQTLRRARTEQPVVEREALATYAFLIEVALRVR